MALEQLYRERAVLARYPEQQFALLRIPLGLHYPVVFMANRKATANAAYFNFTATEDTGYTIHVATHESSLLFYVIDVLAPYHKLVSNGLIVKTRKRWDDASDRVGVKARYQFDDFSVVTNANRTATVFARNLTADPKT